MDAQSTFPSECVAIDASSNKASPRACAKKFVAEAVLGALCNFQSTWGNLEPPVILRCRAAITTIVICIVSTSRVSFYDARANEQLSTMVSVESIFHRWLE